MNIVYENSVLETKLTELFNSKLSVRSLMTVDDSLAEGAGLTKVINRYTYNGAVETLEGGEANSAAGTISFVPETYTVKRYQQTFRYNDVEAMKDPALIDMALAGAADVMANQLRTEYFSELMNIKNRYGYTGDALTYTDIVEALGNIGREVEDGLFILMGADGRTAIRKDPDFIAAHQGEIVYSGQFGTLCGVPVLFSKLVPAGKVIITDKAAVKFFVKKEASIEQSRDIEKKENTIVYERHGLIALVDDTSSVILGKAAHPLTVSANASGSFITLHIEDKVDTNHSIYVKINADAPLLGEQVNEQVDGWELSDSVMMGYVEGATRVAFAEVDNDGFVVASGVAYL